MKKNRLIAFFLLFIAVTAVGGGAMALDDPAPKATSVLIVDGDNREVLYGLDEHEQRFPASITKVMTALLTLEAVDRGELGIDQMIAASDTYQAGLAADGSTQNIRPGEELTVRELLYCTLVASANEACNILAEAVDGSVPAFVERMNRRAAELGMEDTHFVNTHGLHNANHYTTAYDIWLMTEEAMKSALFREVVSAIRYTIPATNLSNERLFYNTNALLTAYRYPGYMYQYAIGIKTGSTPEAGQCLVSAAVRNKRTYYCVVLGAENVRNEDGTLDRRSFSESKRLLEWAFSNFSRKTILNASDPLDEMPVTLSQAVSHVALKPAGPLEATLPNDVKLDDFTITPELYYESVRAPVEAGQVLGRVTVSRGDTVYGVLDLVAVTSVERSELLYRIEQVKDFFGNTYVKTALIIVVAAGLVLLIAVRVRRAGRRKRSRRYRTRR